jgi:hypothetical protein
MQFPPADGANEPPDAREIVRSAARHKKLARRARKTGVWRDDEEPDGDSVIPHLNLDRVSTIDHGGTPVFLVSYLYVPHSGPEASIDWHACDFFGLGSNAVLRQLVERVARGEDGLSRRLDRLLSLTTYGGLENFRLIADARQRRAQMLLDRALTLDVRKSGVAEPLTEALTAWLEIKELGDSAESWRRRGVPAACRRALERLFKEISQRWPLSGIATRLSRDPAVNEARIRGAAVRVGAEKIPESLLHVRPGQIRSATDFGGTWLLRPLVAATLLCAADAPGHPLRQAASQRPTLLVDINTVASDGGDAAHDGGTPQFQMSTLEQCLDTTLLLVGLFSNLPWRPLHEVETDGEETESKYPSWQG